MTFNEVMTALKNGKVVKRPEWNSALIETSSGIMFCYSEDPENEDYHEGYYFDRVDYETADWFIVE